VATIRARCPHCGDVRLRTHQVTVRVCADDDQGSYWFRCPICKTAVAHDARPEIVELLVEAGVRRHVWNRPAELSEVRTGPPITSDDVLDFHLLLQSDEWLEHVSEMVRRPPA